MGAASRGVDVRASVLLGSLLGGRRVDGGLGDSLGLDDFLGSGLFGSGLGLELVGTSLLAGGLLGDLGGFLGLALDLGGLGDDGCLFGGLLASDLVGSFLLADLLGSVAELVGEALDASTGVDELLLAGVERVALGAQFDAAASASSSE